MLYWLNVYRLCIIVIIIIIICMYIQMKWEFK